MSRLPFTSFHINTIVSEISFLKLHIVILRYHFMLKLLTKLLEIVKTIQQLIFIEKWGRRKWRYESENQCWWYKVDFFYKITFLLIIIRMFHTSRVGPYALHNVDSIHVSFWHLRKFSIYDIKDMCKSNGMYTCNYLHVKLVIFSNFFLNFYM